MPSYTSNNLPKPLLNEYLNLDNYNSLIDAIDAALNTKETPTGATAKVTAHANLKTNPHGVTAAQVGAYTKSEADTKFETPTGSQGKVDAHANLKNNPHGVTAAQVGAETPTGAQAKVDAHATLKNNPHNVTKAQIGLTDVINVEQASKTEFDAHATNGTIHTTSSEKALWNAKETPTGAQAKVDAHSTLKNNPHNVTAAQVGLPNTPNFGVATQLEAEAGTSTTKLMTPASTKQAIAKLSPPPTASTVAITDSGNYFTGTNTETALQEIGLMLAGVKSNLFIETNKLINT